MYGPYYEIKNQTGGNNDTVQWPFNKNRRTVYKINDQGEVLWSTEITDIFAADKIYLNDESDFQQAVTQNGDRFLINTLNTTHELSATGQLIRSFQPAYNFEGNHTVHMVKADESSHYFFCKVVTHDNTEGELVMIKYDVAQRQTVWKKNDFYYPYQISSHDDKSFFTFTYLPLPYNNILMDHSYPLLTLVREKW